MKPFFFGPPWSQLMGVYHAPDPAQDRFQGVVLCYPFGQEYMRAHRSFRQLASALSTKGYHVLRFDYQGTGDSDGDLSDVTAEDWLQDIEYAIDELKDMSGVHQVSLLGLRLGALLAGTVSARRKDVAALMLWDPITAGADYIDQVKERLDNATAQKRRSNFVDASGTYHFNGFYISPELRESLLEMDLLEVTPACRRILHLATHDGASFTALAECWAGQAGFEYRHVPAEHDWNYVDHVGGILMPQPVLREIAQWA